ncbi:hypothetical protein ACIBCM_20160 [Streptomyces sp. NPDC051018]|uniref:hypothetical protein n=1 Tax=Streptomyces sp. NPDC051018 TaxID=3365639 RepID=UPI003794F0A8
MTDYRKAALICALAVWALGGGTAAHAAPESHHGGRGNATTGGEIDRNLVKPPPGGMLAPLTDAAGRILPAG